MAGGGGRSATGGSSGASARRVAAAGIAGASGPPMANEGRWTDNGQPLTAAEGRTVLPMLEQVEQAVGARLLPFRQAVAAMAVEAGCRADPGQPENGEFKEEQVRPSATLHAFRCVDVFVLIYCVWLGWH